MGLFVAIVQCCLPPRVGFGRHGRRRLRPALLWDAKSCVRPKFGHGISHGGEQFASVKYLRKVARGELPRQKRAMERRRV
eukprot:11218873-Lingulodinium_polyedra.AAC.1